ncbi:MAG: gliding motility-associated ABC transporter substrate-binding protein GldG [Adhaeribacter sp.]
MVEEQQAQPASRKKKDLSRFLVFAALLVLANIGLANWYFRIDLTEDKRYTISPATRQLLAGLDQDVTIDVYLEGDFPARFKRLQIAVREILQEFQVYSGHLQFNFIDPGAASNEQKRQEYYRQLVMKGLQPTNLVAQENGNRVEKIIFPGAIVSAKGQEVPVMLLKGNQAASPDERLNQSVEGLEYELATAIRQLTRKRKKRIGYIEGHGELSTLQTADLITTLQKDYEVYRVNLAKVPDLKALDAIMVAKPILPYTEAEKFKIDQFIVNGGKALFFLDPVSIELDSIRTSGTVAFPLDQNLQDLLFKYGVRVNGNLVQDINSGQIPMVVGMMGNQPQTQLMNWRYFPVINGFSQHPITRNLDAVYGKFVSTIDTVKAAGIRKQPLMITSPYSRVVTAPVEVRLEEARQPVDPRQFQAGPQLVGVLLEGRFRSVFTNRPLPAEVAGQAFLPQGQPGQVIVVSDGDLVRNDVNGKTMQPYRLGFDRYSGASFANRDFVVNSLDYLLDGASLISLRSKQIKLRPLDRVRIGEEKQQWQLLNLVLPLVLLVLYGLFRFYRRRRRYGSAA